MTMWVSSASNKVKIYENKKNTNEYYFSHYILEETLSNLSTSPNKAFNTDNT